MVPGSRPRLWPRREGGLALTRYAFSTLSLAVRADSGGLHRMGSRVRLLVFGCSGSPRMAGADGRPGRRGGQGATRQRRDPAAADWPGGRGCPSWLCARSAPGYGHCGEGVSPGRTCFGIQGSVGVLADAGAGAKWAQDITGVAVNPKGAQRSGAAPHQAERSAATAGLHGNSPLC